MFCDRKTPASHQRTTASSACSPPETVNNVTRNKTKRDVSCRAERFLTEFGHKAPGRVVFCSVLHSGQPLLHTVTSNLPDGLHTRTTLATSLTYVPGHLPATTAECKQGVLLQHIANGTLTLADPFNAGGHPRHCTASGTSTCSASLHDVLGTFFSSPDNLTAPLRASHTSLSPRTRPQVWCTSMLSSTGRVTSRSEAPVQLVASSRD